MRARRLQTLFERYRDRGDGAALAAVFDATAPRLLELACHLVREPAEAEDLVQSTFLVAVASPRRYDGSAPLEAWLYGVLWREALKSRRRAARKVDPRDLEGAHELDPADHLAAQELPAAVGAALARLPQHEREVLEPFLLEDLRADEIARKLERSAGTVRSQIHRALERLRRELPPSLAPMGAFIPVRGLDAVRGQVLAATGVPPGTTALVVGGGMGSRFVLGAAALLVLGGGWLGLRSALAPTGEDRLSAHSIVGTEPAPVAAIPATEAKASESRREQLRPSDRATLSLTLVNWPKEHPADGLRVEAWAGTDPPGLYLWPPYDRTTEPIAAGSTGVDGKIELELPANVPLQLVVPWQGEEASLEGPQPPFRGKVIDAAPLSPSERREVRLQVLHGREFARRVRIVADEDGHPLSDARVLCTGRGPSGLVGSVLVAGPENRSRWRMADSDGNVDLMLTYEQRFDTYFALLAPGRTPRLGRLVGDVRGEEPGEYRLTRSASLAARLIDDTKSSHPPYRVRLTIAGRDLMDRRQDRVDGWESKLAWERDSDMLGRFEVLELPANARIDVKIFCGARQVFWINGEQFDAPRLTPGEDRLLEWRIRTGTKVTGVAFDKNLAPVANHEIWLLRKVIDTLYNPGPVGVLISDDSQMVVARTVSDEHGRFSFENVEPGTWWVGLQPPPNDQSVEPTDPVIPLAVSFEIPEGVPTVAVDIRAKNTQSIRGKVLAPDGTPLAGAGIFVFRVDDSGPERARSGPDGTFEVVPADSGTWKLKAWAPDLGFADSDVVEAQPGQSGVALRMAGGTKLSGLVVGSGVEDRGAVEVRVYAAGSRGYCPIECRAGDPFELSPLPAGRHDIFAIAKPDRVGLLLGVETRVDTETSGLKLELTRAAVLVISYTGKQEHREFTVSVGDSRVSLFESASKSGPCRVLVPGGTVRLRSEAGGAERVITVSAGTETEVVLDDN